MASLPLLLLPGLLCDERLWRDPAEALAEVAPIHHADLTRDDSVAGMVFQISEDELAAADRYEVADYKRVAVTLASGLTAWVYVRA